MEINGFSAYNGGMTAKISDRKYIAVINREKLPIKFNKIIDYMRKENLKNFLEDPQLVSSKNITIITGRLKKGVKPAKAFEKDIAYLSDVIKKAPVLAMEPQDNIVPYGRTEGQKQLAGNGGLIKITGADLIVKTNDLKVLETFKQTAGKEIKVPATEENKKRFLFAVNPKAGRWQVEGEETMKHMATALHRLADIIPAVHYGELTPELSKKGFSAFKDHLSNSLGLKIQ